MAVVDELVILVRAEVEKAKRDLNGLEKQTDKNKDSASKFSQFMKSPAGFLGGITVAGVGINQLVKLGKDLVDAYATQEKALIQLNTAISNNSNLADGASERFQRFASELQSVSVFGDEVTLSLISQLAAMGRTEDEIKKITQASADYASATGKDFIQSALQINKTFSGLAGELGESVGAIRGLTQEQLKNGAAVDIIAKQYQGFASSTSQTFFGAAERLKNAVGDLKELYGGEIARAASPLIEALTSAVTETVTRRQNQDALSDVIQNGVRSAKDLTGAYTEINKQITELSSSQLQNNGYAKQALDLATRRRDEITAELERREQLDAKTAQGEAARRKAAEDAAQAAEEERIRQEKLSQYLDRVNTLFQTTEEGKRASLEATIAEFEEYAKTAEITAPQVAAVLKALREELASLDEAIDLSQWTDQWMNVKFTTEDLLDRWEEIPNVLIKQKTEVEKIQEWWEKAGKEVEKYSAQIAVAQGAVSAIGDLQSNVSDRYIAGLEEQRDALRKNGQDTVAIEEKILEAKDAAGRREFNSRKFTAIADALMQGASAFVEALPNPALAATVAGLTAFQVGIIGAQEYVPMAQGGIVNGPTRALIGEAGPEAIIPLRDMDKGARTSGGITINQYVSGSIWQTKELEALALGAVAKTQRGY